MFSYNNLKSIARYRIRRNSVSDLEEFKDFLKQWWSEKYKLPDNHPLLLDKTLEELIVEYYTDYYRANPQELNNFEIKNNLIDSSSDEEWFKQTMGEDYTPEHAFSEEFSKDSGKEVVFDDEFQVLGGNNGRSPN